MPKEKLFTVDRAPADGKMVSVSVDGSPVLVLRWAGELRAYGDKCPHLGARLSRGRLEEGEIVCPRHGSRFDALTGEVKDWTSDLPGLVSKAGALFRAPMGLLCHALTIEDGYVCIDAMPKGENA